MSHIATVSLEVKSLDDLEVAAKRLGLELCLNQKEYRWYGRSVGDTPLPAGFKEEDLGLCEHAIRIPGNKDAYEIGVVRRRDGQPGFQLMWDFFRGGYGLKEKVGAECAKLKQEYARAAAMRVAAQQGLRVQQEQKLPNGSYKLVFAR